MQIYPWQQAQWQSVLQQLQADRLPHALLLAGPSGLGKRSFANALAAHALCVKHTACGQCRSCLLLNASNHPDLLELQPEAEGKAIKIEQVRELVTELGQTAQQGSYQVVVIEPAEAMNKAGANALLKTLEEPPGPVIFLLISHQPATIPATIRSRCQRLNFMVPDRAISQA